MLACSRKHVYWGDEDDETQRLLGSYSAPNSTPSTRNSSPARPPPVLSRRGRAAEPIYDEALALNNTSGIGHFQRPVLKRACSADKFGVSTDNETPELVKPKQINASDQAQQRAQRLATHVASHSAPTSARTSPIIPSLSKPHKLSTFLVGPWSEPSSVASTPRSSPPPSGASTPTKSTHHGPWWQSEHSLTSITHLLGSSHTSMPGDGTIANRPDSHRRGSTLGNTLRKITDRTTHLEQQNRIRDHIEDVLARHKYLIVLCRALMQYGAPTHRLEEYMTSSMRTLEIEGQCLYHPGCMTISFEDQETHSTKVRLVKQAQGVDLGKLRDTHQVYKRSCTITLVPS